MGSLKSEIYYLDENNNIVEKDDAYKIIIREFDENGKTVKETFCHKENKNSSVNNDFEVTDEEKEFLKSIGIDLEEGVKHK